MVHIFVPPGVVLRPLEPVVSIVLGLDDLFPALGLSTLGDQPGLFQYPRGYFVLPGLLEKPPLLDILVPRGLREPSWGFQYRRVPFGVRLGRPPFPYVAECLLPFGLVDCGREYEIPYFGAGLGELVFA